MQSVTLSNVTVMPIYCFKSPDGQEVVERFFHNTEVPPTIDVNGQTYKRAFAHEHKQIRDEFRPYISYTLPLKEPGFNHTERGYCKVESRQQEREYAQRKGLIWT